MLVACVGGSALYLSTFNFSIMRSNYFTIHKNKKPKKSKYSKPYSKLQLQKMEVFTQYFLTEIEKIKTKLIGF
ncbi:hypothetical protein FPN187_contig00091-0004 [Flavobacterium psychrophilum]|nr:hypothetical protein FPN185_contig00032-0003 [Flavobacterium psychrophilum]GEJ34186.1 hypothetical protein FPN181_contig00095-0003 [Flavobacterium psychrophilum]GEJ40592.1 hypothetical protein FPN187_contig00091-0004 [Flavobacterium psychrophilum]GEJ40634.1 hypothetical protein FPN182_contig00043-0004 [Flavobacterium psychrophilum]GEJ42940.1 hypothetical protein FPN186_contig00073-0003 [Flavobacterium psychrophilum]